MEGAGSLSRAPFWAVLGNVLVPEPEADSCTLSPICPGKAESPACVKLNSSQSDLWAWRIRQVTCVEGSGLGVLGLVAW